MERGKIPSPKEFFGFEMGEDRKLARWDKIVEYFYLLDKLSDRIKVVELGKTTEGNPFLLAYISSPRNLKNLEKYRRISYALATPIGLSEERAERLVRQGKAVVAITNSLHATEVGGTQMAVELAYELATSDDTRIREILDNVIMLLFPCFNPDGQIMVTDWYYKWLGTEYEGTSLPWLYHKYCGHDNNRDAYMLTQNESRMFAEMVYKQWKPQAYIDNHHMGSYGARFYIPPWYDPICPEIDPLVWREHQMFGAYMAVKLEMAGIKGVEGGPPFTAEWTASFLNLANFLNIVGMLTESATVKIATPIYIHHHQLTGHRGRATDRPQMSFPNPWPGGWWRLRDIVRQQKIANLAALELAAKLRETLLRNMYLKSRRNIERGLREPPYAFIFPPDQHDPLTMMKLIEIFLRLDIQVHRAKKPFRVGGRTYPAGSYVIFTSQPARAFIKYVLEKTIYPDNEWTRARDGTPIRPYDLASYTIPDYMGVKVEVAEEKFEGSFKLVKELEYPVYKISESKIGYLLDPRYNDSFKAVNYLISHGFKLYRVAEEVTVDGKVYLPGTFYIPSQSGLFERVQETSDKFHLDFHSLKGELDAALMEIRRLRIGIYQRYYGGNMDEGWTRWVLEQYGFPFEIIRDKDIVEANLADKVDLLIIPNDYPCMITGENIEEEMSKRFKRPFVLPPIPPEYRSGLKKEGVEKLKEFVKNGGVLVTFNRACEFAITSFKLPIKDLSLEVEPKQFFCPGSMLKVDVNIEHVLGYGMPRRAYVLFHNSPILQVLPSYNNELYEVVASYPERDIMQSGWLIGEEHLSRKPAMISAKFDKGKIILMAFRPQFRAQMHGTFKLFFNTLFTYK